MRIDGRNPDEGRKVTIIPGFVGTADGSCLIETGKTRVICTASVDESVPPFLRGQRKGWVTAEYAMLPASTGRRKQRDGIKKDGRSVEIQRLIGRALRQAIDLTALGERSITVDCDVLEADGGTRTASITGGFVALCLAVNKLIKSGKLKYSPIRHQIAAISCGVDEGEALLDLCYHEDSGAEVDMNIIMNEKGEYIEVQGTGEGRAFSRDEMDTLLRYGEKGCMELMKKQREILGDSICHLPVLAAATGNAHKLKELETLFGSMYQIVSMKELGVTEDIEENGDTFEENAKIKAEAVCAMTGFAALADDSGLCVNALDGAPGVYSARYAGEHGKDEDNNALLIKNMQGKADRSAKFVCALALSRPGETTITVIGECPGVILERERGTGGFGYDPLFLYENGETYAEMSAEKKNDISHRARAAEKMQAVMKKL